MLKKFDKLMIKLQSNVGGVIFLIVFVCCLLQVVFRFIIHIGTPWTEEFSRVGLAYMTFLMSALGIRQNAHPSVNFLIDKLPNRARFSMGVLIQLLICLVGVVLTYYGWQYLMREVSDLATTYHYSKAWWYWPIPASGVIMIIYSIRNIVFLIKSIIKNEDVTDMHVQTELDTVEKLDVDDKEKEDDDL